MDCEDPDQCIELVFTDQAMKQKQILSYLSQEYDEDRLVYNEMARIYGKHVILDPIATDYSMNSNKIYIKNFVKLQAIILFGYFSFKIFRRKK